MILNNLTCHNYRRIPDFDLVVRGHLVLIGPNDSGKSSVLQLLDWALRQPPGRVAAALSERDFTDPSKPLEVQVEFSDFSGDERAAFPDEIDTGPPERLRLRLEASLDPGEPDSTLVAKTFPDAGHGRGPNRDQVVAIGWDYIPASRSMARELGGGAGGIVRSLLSTLDLGSDKVAVVDAVEQFRAALEGSSVLSAFRHDLADALSYALPNVVSENDLKLISESDLEDDPLGDVTLAVKEGDLFSPIAAQSDGLRALTTIAIYGMTQQGANVVGIDEPETHLHPTAQRAVGRILREASQQHVVATHSSHIASRFPPQEVVAFGPNRRVRQLPGTAPATTVQFISRWWSTRLVEPLTAKRVVVVEGPSDRMILESAAEVNAMHLDREAIAILELDGSGQFHNAHALLGPGGFDVPLFWPSR